MVIAAHVVDKRFNIRVAIHARVVTSEAMSPHNLLVASKFSPKTHTIESWISIKIGHFFLLLITVLVMYKAQVKIATTKYILPNIYLDGDILLKRGAFFGRSAEYGRKPHDIGQLFKLRVVN